MATTPIQLQMLSATAPSLLIPMLVSVNGGRFNSTENIGSIELEFSTEETAVVEDSLLPKCMLIASSADKFKVEQEMDNGTLSSAQNQCKVRKSDW
jgi:hypothetical protein